jgi:LacI family transcriptional regulator
VTITRDDVARRAGISTAVVSYVLNNGPRKVSEVTRQKVLQAVRDLNYRPNAVAQALSAGKTRTLGLVVPDNANLFFAELSKALVDAAFDLGYVVLVANSTGRPSLHDERVRILLEKQVDGLIISGVGDFHDFTHFADLMTPVVVLDRHSPDAPVSTVAVDNRAGAYTATEHLLSHGHASVACIAGPQHHWSAFDRKAGWEAAHHEVGVEPRPADFVEAPYDRYGGYYAAEELLGRRDRPTAVFLTTDEQAIAALRAAQELGLRVPEDLAVFSFDGTSASLFTHPPLSVIRQPLAAMAARTLDILLSERRDKGTFTHALVPFETIIRRSCGCPPAPFSVLLSETRGTTGRPLEVNELSTTTA